MLFSLINGLEKTDIILASTSPRRYELLKTLGLSFKVIDSGVKEEHIDGEPIQSAIENSRKKGHAVAAKNPDSLVISADTVVVLDEKILGKPNNDQDAVEMLRSLSGRTHTVISAFSLFYYKYEHYLCDYETTEVKFRKISEEEILAYINTGEHSDKAGAYAIQGQGAVFIEKINGCYYNVVGFPLTKFYIKLQEFCSHYCP
ncbi:MAG: septum formation protein Maf [Calditrichaceae bacterium]|nr:septum formation protein Maf [Calditrichaceae bacterium]MBN2709375.1 septum formation protein Maf [Calditrichaceae bacterium]RQV95749.1 MAG: septum formation protein Maf [Calditrichota bacterium]